VTVLADYTEAEQELLRHAIASAAIAVSAASLGRKEETVSEGFAAADLILKSQPRYVGNTLVTSILVEFQEDLKTGLAFPNYLEEASAPGAFDESLIVLGRVVALLDAKSDAAEAEGYKRWLLEVAEAVAHRDPVRYIRTNLEFHRTLYLRAQAPAMLAMAETVWLQLGPTMPLIYGRLRRNEPPQHHRAILAALKAGDEPGLRLAVRTDVSQGLRHIIA